jgi:hypothetical protein
MRDILAEAQFLEMKEVREHQQFGCLNLQSLRTCLERM